jgi:hypothetical protein
MISSDVDEVSDRPITVDESVDQSVSGEQRLLDNGNPSDRERQRFGVG